MICIGPHLQMLRSITFSIDVDEPDLTERRIMFEIYDGEQWSDRAYATVTIQPVNDNAPNIDLTPGGEVGEKLMSMVKVYT